MINNLKIFFLIFVLDISKENLILEKTRKDYEELKNSIVITVFEQENFFIDEFQILSLKSELVLDVNSKQKGLKLKYNSRLKDLYDLFFSKDSTGNFLSTFF